MEDYMYYVENKVGKKVIFLWMDEALDWYKNNNGISCIAKSKDLFPTYHTIIDQPNVDIERIRKDWSMKVTSKALRKAIKKYEDNNCKQYKIKLNKNTDADIIELLDSLENKQGLIKELIRKYLDEKNVDK